MSRDRRKKAAEGFGRSAREVIGLIGEAASEVALEEGEQEWANGRIAQSMALGNAGAGC